MQKVILNPTPVRTSENYGINDLKVDLKIPKVKNFENYTIISSDVDKLKTYRVQSFISLRRIKKKKHAR